MLSQTLDEATAKVLEENKSPQSAVGTLDNRGSHFYLALYWAEALAAQTDDTTLANEFKPIAQALRHSEQVIVNELNQVQGTPVNLQGYYHPSEEIVYKAMQPSATLKNILGL